MILRISIIIAALLMPAALLLPAAGAAQIRTDGEPQRTDPPQRVSPEPRRVGERPVRVSPEAEPMAADPLILAVPGDSPLAGALREAFEIGEPVAGTLIGWGIGAALAEGNEDAAQAGALDLVVGPFGAAGKYYVVRVTHARVADARPHAGAGVAMEEFVLAHEGFEIEPIASPGPDESFEGRIVMGRDARLVEPDLDTLLGPLAAADPGAVAPPPAGALPDLRIRTAEVDPATPNVVEVRVVNTGQGPAAATRVRVWVMPEGKAWYGIVPALAPGHDAWVTVHADMAVMDADHVYARVDDPHKVVESDEGNNGHVLK